MADVEDEEPAALLKASIAGDTDAFERLVARYKNLVWAVIRDHRLQGADAEDVFQLVFLRLYERQATVTDPDRLGGWLGTTTKRECWSLLRRSARQPVLDPHDVADEGGADHELDLGLVADERHQAFGTAFGSLSEECRRLLRLLSADPQLSYDDIAGILCRSRGSIGPTRQRCIKKLQDHPAVRRISGATGTL